MKNNLDFYYHYSDSHEHPKFELLRSKYDWAGEGKFWALNNFIARSENTILDLNKLYNKGAIATKLKFTIEEFEEFLQFLSSECNLIIYKNGLITTDIVTNCYKEVSQKREKSRKTSHKYYKKSEKSDENEDYDMSEGGQTPVNDTSVTGQQVVTDRLPAESFPPMTEPKGKERKGKEKKVKEINFRDFDFFDDDFSKVWDEFKIMRIKNKKPLTEYAEFLSLQELSGLSGNDKETARKIVERTIKNGWQGLFQLPKDEQLKNKPRIIV